MRKSIALLIVVLLFVLALVPAYYQADDDSFGVNSSPDLSSHVFTVIPSAFDFDHHQGWTGLSLSLEISYRLPQIIPASTETRAPPA